MLLFAINLDVFNSVPRWWVIYAIDLNIKYGKTDCCEDYRKFLATQNRYVIVMVFEYLKLKKVGMRGLILRQGLTHRSLKPFKLRKLSVRIRTVLSDFGRFCPMKDGFSRLQTDPSDFRWLKVSFVWFLTVSKQKSPLVLFLSCFPAVRFKQSAIEECRTTGTTETRANEI